MNFAMHGPPDMLAALHSMEVAPSSSADWEDPECASDSSDSDDDLVLLLFLVFKQNSLCLAAMGQG